MSDPITIEEVIEFFTQNPHDPDTWFFTKEATLKVIGLLGSYVETIKVQGEEIERLKAELDHAHFAPLTEQRERFMAELSKLKQTVEEYREMFDSCLRTGGERLREIAKLKQERDEAYAGLHRVDVAAQCAHDLLDGIKKGLRDDELLAYARKSLKPELNPTEGK